MLIKVNAENDTYGNPRRGWVQIDFVTNTFVKFYPEGYDNGGAELREIYGDPGRFQSMTINVTPKEYKRLTKLVA